MSSRRMLKVNELIHEEISDILQKKIKDPRVGFVTVSDVIVSDDLRYAKVFITVYGSEEQKSQSLVGLAQARGFVRRELGKRIRLRYTPEIIFKFDDTLERSTRIMELLKEIDASPKQRK